MPLRQLCKKAYYIKMAHREAAPWKADCLTAICYIYKHAFHIDIPTAWIGDVPRAISSSKDWTFIQISPESLKPGDLLFVKNVGKKRLISHIAMVVDAHRIFHCSKQFGKAIIQSKDDFFALYEQELTLSETVRYIDFRNEALRDQYGSCFIESQSGKS